MSDRPPAIALPVTPHASDDPIDPLQSVFDAAELMLDSLEVQRGTILALRMIFDREPLSPDQRAAMEALAASLIHQCQMLRLLAADLHRISMEGPAR